MTFWKLVAAFLTAAAIVFVFVAIAALILLWTNYPWG
jgi:hypothetical protein